ncbi:hypothetical protein [Microbacterium sp. zg-YB36]|uniref:hypothetical protein n=1 Tax=Microbacterium sp. zg-YB36 TaxID=2969407 RepID=UPI00214B7B08|nr:hypothetical protein [Microbacterium sp. zg-YB36]MDL5352174.1 hypothetical protein [Microbacterium sp. zg-YB36]
MTTAILLSATVTAHPLFTAGERLELEAAWPGPVHGAQGSEHRAQQAGVRMQPHLIAYRLLTRHGHRYERLAVVHSGAVSQRALLRDFPHVEIVEVVVDADTYTAKAILLAVAVALSHPAETHW